MDTKWKKFKYSKWSRVAVAAAAAFFSIVFIINMFSVITTAVFFSPNSFKSGNASIFDFKQFYNETEAVIGSIDYVLKADEKQQEYEKVYGEMVSAITEFYNVGCGAAENFESVKSQFAQSNDLYAEYYYDECPEADYSVGNYYSYFQEIGRENDFWGYVFSEYISQKGYFDGVFVLYSYDGYFDYSLGYDGENYYGEIYIYGNDEEPAFEDAVYFTPDFDISAFITSNNSTITFFFSDIYSETLLQNDKEELAALQNLTYYAESADGTISTNAESKQAVQRIISSDGVIGYYVFGESKDEINSMSLETTSAFYSDSAWQEYSYGGELTQYFAAQVTNLLGNSGMTLYLVFDDMLFSGSDSFSEVYSSYIAASSSLNLSPVFGCLTLTIVSFAALVALFVCSLRLAGHRGHELVSTGIDRLPWDIHFLICGVCIAGLVYALVILCVLQNERFYYTSSDYTLNAFLDSGWFYVSAAAAAVAVNLLFTELFTSLARNIKTKRKVIMNFVLPFAIGMLIKLFKVIARQTKKAIRTISNFSFKYRYTAFAFLLFFSIIFMAIGAALTDPLPVMGAIFIFLSLLLFAFTLYITYCFLHQLDSVVKLFETARPVENKDCLPKSLKTLVQAYDESKMRLTDAVSKAVKSEQMKSELITNVSHDLKTPLTSIINYSALLQQLDIKDETEKQYISVISEKSNRLKHLIEDLIEVSKVSTGNVTLNKEIINLNELTAQAIAEEAADFDKYELTFVFDDSQKNNIVWADGAKVWRIYQNLLSNAKKYSAPGSRVYARVYSDDSFGCFEIKNISKTQLNISAEKLLERFVRADKARSEEGNGLGLSIAQELCRLNGGELLLSIDGDLFKATVKLPKHN
ncbi:MAG: HAMP domain-containing histidine kinase [Clostridiales bacterium]|nr:HAMP domain-containing histidine kinase [Clostridiales bacterium]